MAKAKTPGTKAKRGSKEAVVTNNPETVLDPVATPVPASVQPEPKVNAEVKANPDVQVVAESKTKVEPNVSTEPKVGTEPKLNAEPKTENKTNSEAKGNSDSKIFEVRKADGRKNLVPINLEDEIRRRAYELSQQRQPGTGGAADDWFAAEREVMQRYHQQTA